MTRRQFVCVLALLVALLVTRHFLYPPIWRIHLIDLTYDPETSRANAGKCLYPFVILLDVGPQGDAALEHELCHWANAYAGHKYPTRWAAEEACGQDAPPEWYPEKTR